MNKKIIEALSIIAEGLDTLTEELSTLIKVDNDNKIKEEKKTNVVPMTKKESEPVEEPEEEVEDDSMEEVTEDFLNELSYNELKAYAKLLGIKASGSRVAITERILGASEVEEEVEEEVKEEKAPKKLGKKKEDPVEEEPVDDLGSKVEIATKDMSDEDLLDLLTDVGVKAKGKRQALVAKVVQAVREGLIEFDAGEEDNEVESEEVDFESVIKETEEYAQATPDRKKAIDEFIKETLLGISDESLTTDDMLSWLTQSFGEDFVSTLQNEDEVIVSYMDNIISRYIDDEGNFIEEPSTPYFINEVPFCCANELAYDDEEETYNCSVCKSAYSAQ